MIALIPILKYTERLAVNEFLNSNYYCKSHSTFIIYFRLAFYVLNTTYYLHCSMFSTETAYD